MSNKVNIARALIAVILLMGILCIGIGVKVQTEEETKTSQEKSLVGTSLVIQKTSPVYLARETTKIKTTITTNIVTSEVSSTSVTSPKSKTTKKSAPQEVTTIKTTVTTAITTTRNKDKNKLSLSESEYEILAKTLYREAGSMGWEGQVWVCSAIINLGKYNNRTIWDMAHDSNTFSVAPIVDNTTPNKTTYKVIDYVLSGGKIPEVKYFREDYYHSFGTPVKQIENICFSK